MDWIIASNKLSTILSGAYSGRLKCTVCLSRIKFQGLSSEDPPYVENLLFRLIVKSVWSAIRNTIVQGFGLILLSFTVFLASNILFHNEELSAKSQFLQTLVLMSTGSIVSSSSLISFSAVKQNYLSFIYALVCLCAGVLVIIMASFTSYALDQMFGFYSQFMFSFILLLTAASI
jgi:hypothetical protein